MPRHARHAIGGLVYHVLNRANARAALFEKPGDFAAFERVLGEAHRRFGMRILAHCIMPNHWHMVLWPREEGELPKFMQWLTGTHTQRWQAFRQCQGTGHVYQGRFKSFPVESDDHFLTVCRYVERNPLRSGLVQRAEDWRWSSLWRRVQPPHKRWMDLLAQWPVRPSDLGCWLQLVNQPQNEAELEALRRSVERGIPFGSEAWQTRVAGQLGLELDPRPPRRPRQTKC